MSEHPVADPLNVFGRFVMRIPYVVWRRLPGRVKDIGWLHGQEPR